MSRVSRQSSRVQIYFPLSSTATIATTHNSRIYQHQTPKETSKDGTYMDSTTRRSTMVIESLFRAQDGLDGGGGIGLSRQNQQPNSTQIFFWPCLRNGPHISIHPVWPRKSSGMPPSTTVRRPTISSEGSVRESACSWGPGGGVGVGFGLAHEEQCRYIFMHG